MRRILFASGSVVVLIAFFITNASAATFGSNACPATSTFAYDPSFLASPQVRQAWAPDQFTKPSGGMIKRYRFIVHMTQAFSDKYSATEIFNHFKNFLIKQPCAAISASIFNENKHTPAGMAATGFILKVPTENIISAEPNDSVTPFLSNNSDPETFQKAIDSLWKRGSNCPKGPCPRLRYLPSPQQILSTTLKSHHNEVYIQTRAAEPIQIIGLIHIKLKDPLVPYYKKKYEEITDLSQQTGLPLVEISEE